MTQALTRRTVLGGMAASGALSACGPAGRKFDAQVIVLGAGLAGLHAARILTEENVDVLVLEGSTRIGGRLHTLDHGEHGYTEAGGEQVGASYARIINTAHELGIKLIPDSLPPAGTAYHYKGKLFSPEDWKTGPTSGRSPAGIFFGAAAKANPLEAPQDWRNPKFSDYHIPAQKFLEKAGVSEAEIAMINHSVNANDLTNYSMINVYRSLQLYSQSRGMGPSLSVEFGAQRLPEAMAASLPRPVITGAHISEIREDATGVALITRTGKTYYAPRIICALPFGAMRHIKLEAPISEMQGYSMNSLPYTHITQVHLKANREFWNDDGLPGNMWTDGFFERLFASRKADGTPDGLFRFWINGRGAQSLQYETDEDLGKMAALELNRLRPASGGDVEVLGVKKWNADDPFSGGAYMHWGSGSYWNENLQPTLNGSRPMLKLAPSADGKTRSTYQKAPPYYIRAETMGAPTPRIAFAGEHLSYLHTGMEGAMESAENAALHILDI